MFTMARQTYSILDARELRNCIIVCLETHNFNIIYLIYFIFNNPENI